MFQCYMQPAQEKVSCPQISTVPLPSLVPTGHSSPALSTPGRGAPSLPSVPAPSQQMWEPARLWASPGAQAAQPCSRCSWPVAFYLLSVRGSAGSLELIQHRIRNWHFLMRTTWTSGNCHVFYSLHKAWPTGLRSLPGLTHAGAGWGRAGLFPKEHCTNTARAATDQAQPQHLSRPSSSSWSITTAQVPKMGVFTHMVVTTPGMSLTLELGGGIRLLRLPIWAKPKWTVWNTVLKHWGVIPSQCSCLTTQGAVKAEHSMESSQCWVPWCSSVPSATLTTLTHSGTYGWWFASAVWFAFSVDETIQGRTSTKIKDFFHLPLHLSIYLA